MPLPADKRIRVVIVDDSRFIRQMFSKFLLSDPRIDVVGTAEDPYAAREIIKQQHPDVITLDIEMPKMDGLSFLDKIMTLKPMPVVMVSTLTQKGAEATLRALESGAVDYIAKPEDMSQLGTIKDQLIEKVKLSASVDVQARSNSKSTTGKTLPYHGDAAKWLIAIGASTGGVEAIRELVAPLPANAPPIVITQHMPEQFTGAFANRLNGLTAMTVQEASDDMVIRPGNIYIAPGGKHLTIMKQSGRYICRLDDGDLVSGHRPSVDKLFHSVAELSPTNTVGVILTGMGQDGGAGLLAMRQAGAATIGQDAATCVVYGMPKVAYGMGAVEQQYSLNLIAAAMLKRAT